MKCVVVKQRRRGVDAGNRHDGPRIEVMRGDYRMSPFRGNREHRGKREKAEEAHAISAAPAKSKSQHDLQQQ